MISYNDCSFTYVVRKVKKSFRKEGICIFPSYEALSSHWKEKIVVPSNPLFEKDTDIVIGMYYDPVSFISKHMARWLERREMEGKPLAPGSYILRFKVRELIEIKHYGISRTYSLTNSKPWKIDFFNKINPGYSWQSLYFAQVPLKRSLVYILQFC